MKHLETGATSLVPERKSARSSFAENVYDRNCPSVWSQLSNFIFSTPISPLFPQVQLHKNYKLFKGVMLLNLIH